MSDEGIEIGSVAMPPCDCGAIDFDGVFEKGSEVQCQECGLAYYTADEPERVLTAEGYIRVHSMVRHRLDGEGEPVVLMRISTGKDDQRPDHDPDAGIYRPINVMRHMYPKGQYDDSFYSYDRYCGNCRRRWEHDYDWTLCPYCGVTIGNYVFAHGLAHWYPEVGRFIMDGPPGVLPEGVEPELA